MTPWGLDGPAAEWPSSALTRAHASGAAAGVRRNLGAAAGSPIMAGARVHEADAGLALALATWAALIARDTTGAGQIVDVAATEAMMTIDRVDISIAANDGGPPPIMSSGRTSFGGRMDCADGHVITVTPQPHQWTGLLRAMGDPAWAYDEHGELRDRIEIVDEASAAIDEWAGARTRDEVYRLLQAESAPAGPVLRPSEVMVSEAGGAARLLRDDRASRRRARDLQPVCSHLGRRLRAPRARPRRGSAKRPAKLPPPHWPPGVRRRPDEQA